ncbi:MAG TPA: hypothetical protein VJC18_07700, partial [bacterium]|nr:hypothetical protein [bacterium]
PEVINSLEAQVGEVNFDTLYAAAGDEFNGYITSLIEDDPELMALFATQAGGEGEGDWVMGYLSDLAANTDMGDSNQGSLTDDARALADMYGLGEGFDWVINQEDLFASAEMAILDRLAEYDQAMADLVAALESGALSDTQFATEVQNCQFAREVDIALLQQMTDTKMSLFETISKIYNQTFEMQKSIINNIRVS